MEDIRAAKLELLRKEIEAKALEIEFGKLKLEQLSREASYDRVAPSENRILTFAAPINRKNVQEAIRTLDVWSRQTPDADFTILLHSEGGEVISGFALHDFIRELSRRGHRVTIKVVGSAMSMAVTLLQAADERVITPNSWILIHEAHLNIDDTLKTSQIAETAAINSKMEDKILNVLAAKSNMTASQIKRKWKNREWMLNAEEALKLGFVDRIEA